YFGWIAVYECDGFGRVFCSGGRLDFVCCDRTFRGGLSGCAEGNHYLGYFFWPVSRLRDRCDRDGSWSLVSVSFRFFFDRHCCVERDMVFDLVGQRIGMWVELCQVWSDFVVRYDVVVARDTF